MRDDGLYVTIRNNGERDICNVTYLKSIPKIKKAFNIQYANTYATLNIVKVENGIETIIYVKQFEAVRNTNWVSTERTTEAGWNDLASFEPAEAEVESQPAEVDSQPAEVENQPAEEPAKANKIKGRYIAIQMKVKNIYNEMLDRYYLVNVSFETNKNNIMKFTDSFVDDSIAVAYIVDEYPNKVIIRSKKEYSPDRRTYWVRKKDVLSNSFLDDFRK